jgi:2-oxoglutarate ferredoxin oxidoreductase subunit gamma
MFANIIALGAIVGLTGIVSRESLISAVLARVPKGTEDKNRRAIDLGFEMTKDAS